MIPIYTRPRRHFTTLPLVGFHAEVSVPICWQRPHQSARSGNQKELKNMKILYYSRIFFFEEEEVQDKNKKHLQCNTKLL